MPESKYTLQNTYVEYDLLNDEIVINASDSRTDHQLRLTVRKDTEAEKYLRVQLTKMGAIRPTNPTDGLPSNIKYPEGKKPSFGYYELGETSNHFIAIWDINHDETALLITGGERSGKTNLLKLIIEQSAMNEVETFVFQKKDELVGTYTASTSEEHAALTLDLIQRTATRTTTSPPLMIILDQMDLGHQDMLLLKELFLKRKLYNFIFSAAVNTQGASRLPAALQPKFTFRIGLSWMTAEDSWAAVQSAQASLSEKLPGRAIFSREDFADYYPVPFQAYRSV